MLGTSVADAWAAQGAHPPASHANEVRMWRDAVHGVQQRCERMCRCAPHIGGLGSKLHHAATCLLLATLERCAIAGDPVSLNEYTTNQTLRAGCVGFVCYFRPISTCEAVSPKATRVVTPNQLDLLEPLARVANMSGLRSELLVMSTLVAYVTRPQQMLEDAATRLLAHTVGRDITP
eukprot:5998091-Prymnesium_polylepis.1